MGDAAHPMCPFQGQGANMGMVDGLQLAQHFADLANNPTMEASMQASKAKILEADIVKRGRKAVLESRNAAKQFHTTSRLQQGLRNLGFGFGNFFIKLASKK